MTRLIRMELEYDGAAFHGFQRQPNTDQPTVQGALEALLSQVLAQPTQVIGAGRTDTGVHATGQVVCFDTTSALPVEVMRRALNGLMRGAMVVRQVQEAEPGFHARHSARSRRYEYLIYNHAEPPSVMAGYVWHVWRPLQLETMRSAASVFLGRHDFRSFSSQASHLDQTCRTVLEFSIEPVCASPGPAVARRLHGGSTLVIGVEAEAFLPHMVRMMVGTIVRIGQGDLPPIEIQRLLDNPRDGTAGPLAPPHGLCLVAVRYQAPGLTPAGLPPQSGPGAS